MRIIIRTKLKDTAGGNVLRQMLTAYEVFDYIYDFPVFFLLLSKKAQGCRPMNIGSRATAGRQGHPLVLKAIDKRWNFL